MVGHHDPCRSRLQGLPGPLDGHDPLEEEGDPGVLHDLPQLGHRLGAGGRGEPLEEGQAGGVDVHGEHLGPGGLGLVQLGEQGVPVPGLHRGDPLAPVGPDGLGGGGEDGGVGAVAGEGGDPGLDAGGDQDLVILLVGELVAVMELHRAHRTGEDGQVVGLAEERAAGVHRAVGADRVHIQADVLPGVVVPDGHRPRPLGPRAGHGVPAGPAVADRTGFAVRTAAGPGSGQDLLIRHGRSLLVFLFRSYLIHPGPVNPIRA